MTDKQIIIDGVDVSGCCFYEKHYTEDEDVEIKDFCKIFHYYCETEPNCYFKQLTRKTRECETLLSQLDFEVQKKECLEQKHEELKNIINEAENSGLDLKSFLLGEAIQEEYEEQIDQLKATKEQAEQKLEKVRQVCAKAKDVGES